MPRKHREIRSSLQSKGFAIEEGRKHIVFIYVDLQGRTTTARTMLSHDTGSADIGDGLLGKMARQVKLHRNEFLRLIDCPMIQEEYDGLLAVREAEDSSF